MLSGTIFQLKEALMRAGQMVSQSRRDFLRETAGFLASSSLFSLSPYRVLGQTSAGRSKVVIVTFGGGARDDETFSLGGQRNIPHLLNDLAPQSCFFTQVVNRGILGHYVATASIATGVYETFDNFVSQAPAYPTLFEYFRAGLRRPLEDAWVIAPGNGFRQMGASRNRRYGPSLGAEMVLPKHLLAAVLGNRESSQWSGYLDLLRDNYETPENSPAELKSATDADVLRLIERLKLHPEDLRQRASHLASPDELSVYMTRQIMRQFAPSLLFVTLHDIDIAHTGAFSLYLEGIQRTDRLCAELWSEIQSQPEYKDRTTMFILPDFGRDGDGEPGGNGFQHHRTGGALARTTWMMALGPHVRQHTIVDRVIEPIDLVPTVGKLLGFDAPLAAGRPIAELV